MMRTVRLLATPILCSLTLLSAATIPAQETALEIDPEHTKVEFTLGDVLHTVHGSFSFTRGNVRFDNASGKASGELIVDATSGASGSQGRDHRMHSNILESALFHDIVFRPDHIEGKVAPQGTSHVQIHGIFAIHGTEHEIIMPVDVEAADGQYTATAHFFLPYVKWGMKNPSTLMLRVSDKVELTIHTIARPAH
ncbi:MAG TPA: YceI family protein [Bryobacteraceae bacterium]|nr:YceI family protein [Bryobacteraceae bacterium]